MQESSRRVEPSAADETLFRRLRRDLEAEIADYVYEIPQGALGNPLAPETISSYLNSMRRCLVEPYWEEAMICTPAESFTGTGVKRMCVAMAEENDYVLIFDPIFREYHLAFRSANGLGTWGIQGAGVDCFIAR